MTQPFRLVLPEQFIEIPSGELDEAGFRELAADIATLYGIDPSAPIDEGLGSATALFHTAAASAAAGGSSFTAGGIFRSPDVPERPIMVLVNCFLLESDHDDTETAIAGLTDVHRNTANGPVRVVELPAGNAVIAENHTSTEISVGENSAELREHAVTAWFPTTGMVIGVAVTSNNTEDWDHVRDLADGIFDAFDWAPEEAAAPGRG